MMLAKYGEYELSTYDHGYVIERVSVVGAVNPLTGEPTKNEGAIKRTDQRFYGRIDFAVLRMAELSACISAAVDSLESWLVEYRRAGIEIGKAVKK
jgi:hypothetical protein